MFLKYVVWMFYSLQILNEFGIICWLIVKYTHKPMTYEYGFVYNLFGKCNYGLKHYFSLLKNDDENDFLMLCYHMIT